MLFSWVLSLRKSPSYVEELLRARIIRVHANLSLLGEVVRPAKSLLLSELPFHSQ